MATATRVDVQEYLQTVYRPDVEYLDGIIEQRNVGEWDHNQVQYQMASWFRRHGRQWDIRAVLEQRTRLSARRYRIPDVSVFPRSYPIEQIFTRPQLIAIEVLSPEDRRPRIHARLTEFLAFGVKHTWVVNPQTRQGWDCSTGEWLRCERFEVAGTPIYLSLPELFAELDAEEA